MFKIKTLWILPLLFLAANLPLMAQSETAPAIDSGDTAWMLTSTAFVLLMMLPALALFYGGLVRAKNLLSVLMHCLMMAGLASVLWAAGLYSLVFKGDGGWIGNLSAAGLRGITPASVSGTIPEPVFVMFQMTFAIITPGLVIGAFVERIKFSAVIVFTVLWSVFVYAPVGHWVWGNGWMMSAEVQVIDLAGGIVVHATAGVSALVIAAMLGKRNGFPNHVMPPHSPWMVVVGTGLLWVGWFGFNAGSQVAANGSAGMTMLVTHLAAASGTLTWALVERLKTGKTGIVGAATGTIAGLATVTPASGVVGPAGAIALGIAAGIVCYFACSLVKGRLGVDDSLDVFAVHGLGGIMGSILLAVLGTSAFGGFGSFDMGPQLLVQLKCVGVVVVWSAVATVAIVKIAGLCGGLRVSPEEEETGLDDSCHGEKAYHV
ncbi:MAG: ammonium transporter [Akkermansiaceae bacterium]|nr:ammonium transporter [Akkermansiaceae bacterium]MCP5549044.1 ammonium transporter [Akkermansiaceae bacterium]